MGGDGGDLTVFCVRNLKGARGFPVATKRIAETHPFVRIRRRRTHIDAGRVALIKNKTLQKNDVSREILNRKYTHRFIRVASNSCT